MSIQAFCEPLTQYATFLVVSATARPNSIATIKHGLTSLSEMIKNVAVRCPGARLSCNAGIGSSLWDRLYPPPHYALGAPGQKPRELCRFKELHGGTHTAVSTPGDLLFHIRAERHDVVFEFERQLLDFLGESVSIEDETVGFRYFDGRDLLGFVDGTANPDAQDLNKTVRVSAEDDPAAVGGCYIVVQKYVHDMGSWAKLSTEQQQNVIGRTKFDNIELSDAPASQQKAHKTLATVVNKYGEECEILRDNMPFGNPGQRIFGTYFVGYCKDLWVIEKMLERMFIGDPPGKYDKILDYSKAVTGATFYAPPARVLQLLDD